MYFVIRKNAAGKFWWRAVGDNNEIMAASQLMTTKQSCESSIATMKAEAPAGKIVDKTHEPKERGDV